MICMLGWEKQLIGKINLSEMRMIKWKSGKTKSKKKKNKNIEIIQDQ